MDLLQNNTPLLLPAPHFIRRYFFYICIIVALLIGVITMIFASQPPTPYPKNQNIEIPAGENLQDVATLLKGRGVIRSIFIFRSIVIIAGGEKQILHGVYAFNKPESAYVIARRLINGDHKLEMVKLVIPEGISRFDIATKCAEILALCTKKSFLKHSDNLEGYLFPDTYFFLPHATSTNVIEMMHDTYMQKIKNILPDIKVFGKTEAEVIIMASLLEGEARQKETRQIVAGILWKRIALGMPLQVDATFKYINGKTTADLTLEDLKIDSPYNTYRYRGLPPTPISNPGLETIVAAITPIKTPYLYFLTSPDGIMHYAVTFAEHVANKRKYLK